MQQLLALRNGVIIGVDDLEIRPQPPGGFLRRRCLLLLVIVIVVCQRHYKTEFLHHSPSLDHIATRK